MKEFLRRSAHPPDSLVRSMATGLVLAAIATLPAALPADVSTATMAMLYVLAVAGAAAVGGVWAGAAASLACFLALNFFFTAPIHTFRVEKTEDFAALFVFLVVGFSVGTLVSTVLAHRARSERREAEARLLNEVATRLLRGESPDSVLMRFARVLVDMLDLAECEVSSSITEAPVRFEGRSGSSGEGEVVPLESRGAPLGFIKIVPSSERGPLSSEEREVVKAFAGQLALAIEGMRLASEVRKAQLEAETIQMRAALFSSVTHDLRTPLASITAAVTSLLEAGTRFDEAQRREHLQTIRQEAERLNRLVGNLLDLSRLRAGALVPNKVQTALDEVIEGVVARLNRRLDGHEIEMNLRDDLPEVPLDIVQLDQALTNLIENAAKFGPSGSLITVGAVAAPDRVRVSVSDRGPGIPPADRTRVFEPFEVGDKSQGGSGLGLAIARAVVVAHGGRIWIADAPAGGTSVVFELPLEDELEPGEEGS